MNIYLPIVLSDITIKSGTTIIKEILSDDRDGKILAQLGDNRVKVDKGTIAKTFAGFWCPDHLFELKQHWQLNQQYHKQLQQSDQ